MLEVMRREMLYKGVLGEMRDWVRVDKGWGMGELVIVLYLMKN